MGIFQDMLQNMYTGAGAQTPQQQQNTFSGVMGGALQGVAPMMGQTSRPYNNAQILAGIAGGMNQGMNQSRQNNLQMQEAERQKLLFGQQQAKAKASREQLAGQQKWADAMATKYGFPQGTPYDVIVNAAKEKSKYQKPTTATSSVGKINSDLANGFINEEEADARKAKLNAVNPAFDTDAASKGMMAKASMARFDQARVRLGESRKTLNRIEQMYSLVGRVDSGSLAEVKLKAQKLAKAFGMSIDTESVADAEAMQSVGMAFILDLVSQTKGAISEKEMDAFKAASAGLQNTPDGNKKILAMAQRMAEGDQFVEQRISDALRKNPRMTVFQLAEVEDKAIKEFGSVVPQSMRGTVTTASGATVTQIED
tara:strand:+ start:130 stop:1236 length:1107 start_codon:yes stop_codon:yes gene_type:complete